jgi:hypothetical protein
VSRRARVVTFFLVLLTLGAGALFTAFAAFGLFSGHDGVTIDSAKQVGPCANGLAAWRVQATVRVKNPSSHIRRLSGAQLYVTYTLPSKAVGLAKNVSVVSSGGFRSGTLVAGGASARFHPVLKVSLPCNAESASLGAGYRFGSLRRSSHKGFLGRHTAVPVGTVGVVGLTAILGLILALFQLRRRGAHQTVRP